MLNQVHARIEPLLPAAVIRLFRLARNGKGVDFSLPKRALPEIFTGIDHLLVSTPAAEIVRPRDMVLPLPELLALGAICQHLQPIQVFEIGTYTGSSTLQIALNTPEATEIYTLDLPPDDPSSSLYGSASSNEPHDLVGSVYRQQVAGSKVRQLLGDSQAFDFTPYFGTADLVLIDANHTYSFVKTDTETAFKLIRPGGVIIWDDYVWEERHAECAGVTKCVNEVAPRHPCFQITGTRLAIHIGGGTQSIL